VTGHSLSVDLVGISASHSAKWPYTAVPHEEAGQADLSIPTIAVRVQVHLLTLDSALKPFNQDVVVTVSSS
jgi:hypothetical protein